MLQHLCEIAGTSAIHIVVTQHLVIVELGVKPYELYILCPFTLNAFKELGCPWYCGYSHQVLGFVHH
jgi:hypothetical protein